MIALRPPASRGLSLSFHARLFLLFGCVALAILVVSFLLVARRVEVELESTLERELRFEHVALGYIQGREADARMVSALNIAASPRLLAALSTRDPATVAHEAEKFQLALDSDLFALFDERGARMAVLGHESSRWLSAPIVRDALAGRTRTTVVVVGRTVYRLSAVPLVEPDRVAGALVVGDALGAEELRDLQKASDCDLSLVAGQRVVSSTLPQSQWRATEAALEAGTLLHRDAPTLGTVAGERVYAVNVRLGGTEPAAPVLVLTKSVDQARRLFLTPILRDTLVLGLLTLVALLLASYAVARTVTRPVRALVSGARALQAGDLDHHLLLDSRDEMGYLARAFDQMRESLKQKIEELSSVNRDLAARMEELREAQETLVRNEKLAATGTLVAQLSHELNNPIHNLQTCLEVIRRRAPADDDRHQFIEMAQSEIARMARLTRQLLDFHRPTQLAYAVVDLESVVRETLAMCEGQLEAAHVRTSFVAQEALAPIELSPDHVKQVFLNLVLNAIDAMPQGGELAVRLDARDAWYAVEFRDSGVGIRPEYRSKIFDAFFTTKGAVSGVGLGLSVSWGIVREHGGRIDVADAPGGGAVFTVRLPRTRAGAAPPAVTKESA